MTIDADFDGPLGVAEEAARRWLRGVADRPVRPEQDTAALLAAFDEPLPEQGEPAEKVVQTLVARAEPGLMAPGSPRFHGWVIGEAMPVAVAADWLVSAWDQNAAMAEPFPAVTMIEQVTAGWVLDLLALPAGASIGFVTGGQIANTVCLTVARHRVLAAHGWDVEADGLQGAPRVHVLVGGERHDTVDRALRSLGLGAGRAIVVDADHAGRMQPDALARALDGIDGPTIVCAQAGNVNGGGVDPIAAIRDTLDARRPRASDVWLHVDGAFGMWARTVPSRRAALDGAERADSWSVDAHKWLNTPYDCGMAICADAAAHAAAIGVRAAYLPSGEDAAFRNPVDFNPELSRRARSVPVWAALRHLGRQGIAEVVDRCCSMAERYASTLAAVDGVEVLHQELNQVVVRFLDPAGLDDDGHNRSLVAAIQREGTCYPSGTVWQGRAAVRISVSGWRTSADDVDRSVAALVAAHRS